MSQRFEFTVKTEQSGLRLDQAMASSITQLSRTQSRKILAEGGVFVDKKRVKVAGRPVRTGQRVVVHYNEQLTAQKDTAPPKDVPIIEINADYLVVDKPSGLFSAPTPESDRNDLIYLLKQSLQQQGKPNGLFLVHRLDRPTSGLMVVARRTQAAAELSGYLESHLMKRSYLALCLAPQDDAATLDQPVGEKAARTHFRVLERRGPIALVEAQLETGRMHQVRIHAEAWGAPILGDSKYGRQELRRFTQLTGEKLPTVGRLALHAHRLEIPEQGKMRCFEQPLPEELLSYLNRFSPT